MKQGETEKALSTYIVLKNESMEVSIGEAVLVDYTANISSSNYYKLCFFSVNETPSNSSVIKYVAVFHERAPLIRSCRECR